MELTSENVQTLFKSCLFDRAEDAIDYVEASGAMMRVGFNPERLKEKRQEIEELLNQLPDEFKKSKGGGWTFLNACYTSSGNLWGQHENVDQLLCLGLGIDKVNYMMPRKFWCSLPGGMPYFVVND